MNIVPNWHDMIEPGNARISCVRTCPHAGVAVECRRVGGNQFMRNLGIVALCAALAGCASAASDIAPSYVSPVAYQSYTCQQLALEAQALAFADATQVEAGQCFRAVADEDRDRTLTWQGEQPSGSWLGRTFAGFVRQCAQPAVMLDPQVARAVLRRSQLLDRPDDLMKRDGVIQRIVALQPQLQAPPPGSFPSRPELLELMAQALPS